MEPIRKAYEEIEMPDRLRDAALEHIQRRAEKKGEKPMKRHIKLKRPAVIALAGAAALAMAVSAGAVFSGAFHKDTVDSYLGDGATEELQEISRTSGKVILTDNSVENAFFRITVDAVLSDGDTAIIYVTKERLTDEKLGIEFMDDGTESEWVNPEFEMEDGTMVRNAGFSYDWMTLPEDGVTKWKYEVNGIDPTKGLVMDFADHHLFLDMMDSLTPEERQAVFDRPDYDEYHNEQIHPYYVQGLTMTLDVSQNFEPTVFVNEEGQELTATPYRIYTQDEALFNASFGGPEHDFTLHFLSPGASQAVGIQSFDQDWDATNQSTVSYHLDFDELIKDFDQVTEIRIDGIGTFTKK